MTPPYEDLAALRRDARLLDRLAAGNEMLADRDEDVLVDLLASLRDEARTPLPETTVLPPLQVGLVARPGGRAGSPARRRGRTRATAGAVAALVSLSLTGVAAAVGGDAILAPIRAAIAQVVGGEAADQAEAADVRDSVEELLAEARAAVARGDAARAESLLAQARAMTAGLEGSDVAEVTADDLTAEIAVVAEATAAAQPDDADAVDEGSGEGGGTKGGAGGSTGGSGSSTSTEGTTTTGQEVAPGRLLPPGQSGDPSQASAPGQSAPPGSEVEPPRVEPTRPEQSGGGGASDSPDGSIPPELPATTGSAGTSSQGRSASAGGEPAEPPGAANRRGR